jgi:kinesin family protein 5
VYIDDVTEMYVEAEDDIFNILQMGNENRSIGVTNMNE